MAMFKTDTLTRKIPYELRLVSRFGLIGALVLALVVRLPFVLGADFPLNDGGMFYAMVRDLQQAHYALPVFTSYNSAGIPFAYPPLSFYLAGLVDDLLPIGLIDVFRFLPLVINLLTIVALYYLIRSILSSRIAAAFAAVAFAMLPRSFEWLIMGGGLTRSVGFLFAILTVHQMYLVYVKGGKRRMVLTALFAGCVVMSHLEMASFAVYSIIVLFLVYGRNLDGIKRSALVAIGAALVSSPWWVTIIVRHGLAPLTSASDQGWPLFEGVSTLFFMTITNEPFFPIIGCAALIGALACLKKRMLLPFLWLVPIYALDPRSAPTLATVPVALLSAVGCKEILLPMLGQLEHFRWPQQKVPQRVARMFDNGKLSFGMAHLVIAFMLVYAVNAAIVAEQNLLSSLTADQRDAMEWVSEDTPRYSSFLVITGETWAVDKTSEWFPILANWESVATAQGQEWTGAFRYYLDVYGRVQTCASGDAECLDNWASQSGLSFTHVYVDKESGAGADDSCSRLRNSLAHDPEYMVVYDGPGATVYSVGNAISQLR